MIKVSNEVTIREVDGKEIEGLPVEWLTVSSHWNRASLVVLEIAGKRLTVAAEDLRAAIENATNTRSVG